MPDSLRIDKWLWSVRIFKTRSLAAEECRKGRVTINQNPAKPAREVAVGDLVTVRKPPVVYTYKVIGLPKGRVGAKLAPDFMEDLTPREELLKLNRDIMAFNLYREKGLGRPTKKERRSLDSILDSDWDDWDD